MPKEVLHLLYGHDEAKPLVLGEPIHIETHGVAHVVIQVERKRYPRQPSSDVVAVEGQERKLLTHRPKSSQCDHCRKPMAPQGRWKHERYCEKNPHRLKRRSHR